MSASSRPVLSRRNLPRILAVVVVLFLIYSYLRCSPYVCPPRAENPLDRGVGYPREGNGQADAGQQNSNLDKSGGHTGFEEPPKNLHTKSLIVAAMKGEDTSWLDEFFSDWDRNVYVMNDPTAKLTVAKNKGRESMAYLTFLIDNYHDLPEFMVFLHSLRYQWHNEDPMYGK